MPVIGDMVAGGLLDLVPDLMCVCKDGLVRSINAAGLRMLGAESPAAVLGQSFAQFVHPDLREILDMGLDMLAEEAEAVPLIFLRPDGRQVEVELTAHLIVDHDGMPAVALHARDVTERTRAAEVVLRSEDRYRRLVEQALDCTCVIGGGLVTFINGAGVRLFGATNAFEVVGRRISELVHDDYQAVFDGGLDVLADEDGPLPLKMRRFDGRVIDAEVAVMRLGGGSDDVFMLEARDVTELKQSAEALREREQRLQGIMDAVAEGIVVADDRGIIQSVNPAALSTFGYTHAELAGRNLAVLMPSGHAVRHDSYMRDYERTHQPKVLGMGRELEGQRKDGSVFPVELNVAELKRGRQRLFIGVIRDITERKRAEEALRRANDELELRVEERTRELARLSSETRQILNSAKEGIVGLDSDLMITFANPAAAAMIGWPVDELVGKSVLSLMAQPGMRALFGGSCQLELRRRDGSTFPSELASAPIEEGSHLTGHVVVFRDITERLRAEESQRLAATVFERTNEAIIVLNSDHRVTAVNPAFTAITGYHAEDVMGRHPSFLTSGLNEAESYNDIWEAVRHDGRWEGELWNLRKNGERYAERLAITAIHDDSGAVRDYVVLSSDITQRKLDEERIRYQANYDALTGLPNRALFMDRLTQAVATAGRSGQMVGLMFIDLDGFKLVNDTLGHDIGDKLLQEAGRRLGSCIRTADTVARLGGDEFTIIMPDLRDIRNAPIVAQRIIESLELPFSFGNREAFVSASIGITSFPDDAQDTHSLLKNADAAMYRAKEQGKANYQFFTQDLNADISERMVIKNGLTKALEREEFTLYYQPKIGLVDGCITGVEGLLRWRNPELGMVSPVKFIPIMEETGMIGPVGEWVIEVACQQHKQWAAEGFPIRVAVNLSVRQLRQPGLAKTVDRILSAAGIPPSGLELEITESMIMKDTENAVSILRELHEMGIHLAMDDFGTGYSSLSYLKRFPLHTIKIDRSFVNDIAVDTDDHEIIKTIITMGHSLRRRIVAEGVETVEQLAILKRLACDEIQGYLVSPPVPAVELSRLLKLHESSNGQARFLPEGVD